MRQYFSACVVLVSFLLASGVARGPSTGMPRVSASGKVEPESTKVKGSDQGIVPFLHSGSVRSAAVSPAGDACATASTDGSVNVWDAATGKRLSSWYLPTTGPHTVFKVTFSPKGDSLAIARELGVYLWNWKKDVKPKLFADSLAVNHFGTSTLDRIDIRHVLFSPGGERIAWRDVHGRVRVADVVNGREQLWFEESRKGLLLKSVDNVGIAFVTEDLLLFACEGNVIKLWDVKKDLCIRQFTGHKHPVVCLACVSNGNEFYSGSDDHTFRVWEIKTGKELRRFTKHTGACCAISISPDGKMIATGDDGGTARIFPIRDPQAVREIKGPASGIMTLEFSHDGKKLYIGGEDPRLRVWDVKSGLELHLAPHSQNR